MNALPLLDPLLRQLDGLTEADGDSLARALRVELDEASLLSQARFEVEAYTRICLHRTDRYEVRLQCWRAGRSSLMHAHATSASAFRVLTGTAQELRLDGSERQLRVGDVTAAVDTDVRQLRNPDPCPLVTLHVYMPPLPETGDAYVVGPQVVVIGGGWSGIAVAIGLLRRGPPGLQVTVVERRPGLGRGVAYATTDPEHLLNVPAGDMSLDPDTPGDFVDWAQRRRPDVDPSDLLPRKLYGEYVVDHLRRAILKGPGSFRVERDDSVDLVRRRGSWRVHLASGSALAADHVVLATGHGLPRLPQGLRRIAADPALYRDPWAHDTLANLDPEVRVLLVGTGLSALDLLITLRRVGHRGPITAISRNGRWPRPHLPWVTWIGEPPALDASGAPRTADGLAQWLSAHIDAAALRGIPWQAVVNTVGPLAPALWTRLSTLEQRRFLQEHRSAWEILRHRTPVATDGARRAWEAEGWLTTMAGTPVAARRDGDDLVVEVSTDRGLRAQRAARIIVCTGPESDLRLSSDELWQQLIDHGTVVPDVLGLGLHADEACRVLGMDGVEQGLWAIGGLLRPGRLESSAVPDLRAQATTITTSILQAAASRTASVDDALPQPRPLGRYGPEIRTSAQ